MLATTVNSDRVPASAKRQTRRWRSLDRVTPRSSAIQQATRPRIDEWALENAAVGVPVVLDHCRGRRVGHKRSAPLSPRIQSGVMAGSSSGSHDGATAAGARRETPLLTAAAVIIPIVEIPQSSKKKYW